MTAERLREGFLRLVPRVLGDERQRPRTVTEFERAPLQAQPADVLPDRFPDHRREQAMEVERRERDRLRDLVETQRLVEMPPDVHLREQDPLFVFFPRDLRHNRHLRRG